jgi:hypothetical protein
MPFEDIVTEKLNKTPMATVSYMPSATRGNKQSRNADRRPRLIISVPTTICGASKSKAFTLAIGTGSDAGKLLIRGSTKPDVGIEPTQLKHYFRWHFGYVPKLGDEHFDGEKVPVRKVSAEEFELTVPRSWFEVSDDA